ncbi:hypothetical protein [Paraphotobacterium marinum]|uniref:hypothetical protein n=1 Tax=Paraphotobacterium marinum TaxID=1755811 RepID=UPI0039EA56BE
MKKKLITASFSSLILLTACGGSSSGSDSKPAPKPEKVQFSFPDKTVKNPIYYGDNLPLPFSSDNGLTLTKTHSSIDTDSLKSQFISTIGANKSDVRDFTQKINCIGNDCYVPIDRTITNDPKYNSQVPLHAYWTILNNGTKNDGYHIPKDRTTIAQDQANVTITFSGFASDRVYNEFNKYQPIYFKDYYLIDNGKNFNELGRLNHFLVDNESIQFTNCGDTISNPVVTVTNSSPKHKLDTPSFTKKDNTFTFEDDVQHDDRNPFNRDDQSTIVITFSKITNTDNCKINLIEKSGIKLNLKTGQMDQ